MKRIDFYKELYFKEHERKKSLNDALTLPVGVVTVQIGLLFYFYNNYISKGFATIPLWTTIIFFATVLCLLICIAFLIYSYFELKFKKEKYFIDSAFDYLYLDLTKNYEVFYSKSLAYYDETNTSKESKSDIDFEENIIKDVVKCNDNNTNLNDIKTGRLWKAKLFLVIALLLNFSLLTYPFFNETKNNSEQIIKINQPIKVNIMDNQDKPKVIPPKEQSKDQPKVKPDPTKVRSIPESKEPPKGGQLLHD